MDMTEAGSNQPISTCDSTQVNAAVTTPPDITISGRSSNYNPEWNKNPPTVRAETYDGATINGVIRYSWNNPLPDNNCQNSPEIIYCGGTSCEDTTKQAPSQGSNTIYACVKDSNGETDKTLSFPFFIDTSGPHAPPTITDSVHHVYQQPAKYQATLTAIDCLLRCDCPFCISLEETAVCSLAVHCGIIGPESNPKSPGRDGPPGSDINPLNPFRIRNPAENDLNRIKLQK